MRWSPILTWIGILSALGAAGSVEAANPRVTLKLERVTCEQALEALNRVSGVSITLAGVQRPADPARGRIAGPQAVLDEPASFEWTNAPLGKVVRELCARYQLRLQQFGSRFTVMPGGAPRPAAAPPGKPRFLVEREGFRLYAVSVSSSSQRGLNLETGENRSTGESLTVAFKVEWPEGEPDALIGFDSVAARDDLGNVLNWRRPFALLPPPQLGALFPDEWQGTITLLDPQPRARKLAWLEGELLVYSVYRPVSLELPLEGATLPVVGKLSRADVELVRVEQPPPDAGFLQERGPTVITRVVAAVEEGNPFPDRSPQVQVDLVGASGKLYPSRSTNSSGVTRNGQAVQELRTEFPPVKEPIRRVIYRTVERREPRRLVSFRFENIPIPPSDILPPVVAAPAPLGLKAPAYGPFSGEGGVDLQLRTELKGRAAPDGVLSVGLSRREAEGWSSVRWQETDVELGGLSRIRGLRPGKYRLLRSYRPRVAVDPGGDGRWEGGEVEFEVTPGKALTLPPLRWVSSRPAPLAPPRPKSVPKSLRTGGR